MKNITTGADRLVQIISERKKITLDEAAKILNVEKDVLREWAEFLEQEQHISIDYNFSTVWLKEKQITHKDVVNVAKEITSEREALERKIEAVIHSLEHETSGFETVRAEFDKIHEHIKNEIETVKRESQELENFETLKKNIDKDIEQQEKEYQQKLKNYKEALLKESEELGKVQSKLDDKKKLLTKISEKMTEMERKRQSALDEMKKFEDELNKNKKDFSVIANDIQNLNNQVTKTQQNIDKINSGELGDLLKIVDQDSKKIKETQNDLLIRVREKMNKLEGRMDSGSKIFNKFQGTIMKKVKTEKMIETLEKDKLQLQKNLVSLKKKVHSFSVIKKDANVRKDLNEIEKEIHNYEDQKNELVKGFDKLVSFIKSS